MKVDIIAFSTKGCQKSLDIAGCFPEDEVNLFAKTTADSVGIEKVECSMREWTERSFAECDAIVFVGAVGIAVREIAPFIRNKTVDPAVISVDELGTFCIPILSGHIGGANGIAVRVAGHIGAVPVVTTATDINGKIAIDAWAVNNDLSIVNLHAAKDVAARILSGDPVGFVSDVPVKGDVPPELSADEASTGVYVGNGDARPFETTLRLVPRDCVLGIGCRRDTPEEDIEGMVSRALAEAGISMRNVRAAASIDLKKDEAGLLAFASKHSLPITFYTADELNAVPGEFSKSGFVQSVTAVDCVCERSAVKASRGGSIILRKYAGDGVTVAIAREDFSVDFTRYRK